jgi:hypothetical protein
MDRPIRSIRVAKTAPNPRLGRRLRDVVDCTRCQRQFQQARPPGSWSCRTPGCHQWCSRRSYPHFLFVDRTLPVPICLWLGYNPARTSLSAVRGASRPVALRRPYSGQSIGHSGFPASPTRPENVGDAGWSSPVARQAHNLKVVGSNPAPATTFVIVY